MTMQTDTSAADKDLPLRNDIRHLGRLLGDTEELFWVLRGLCSLYIVRLDTQASGELADQLVRRATLFDIYKPKAATADIGEGERSLAVRLELLDDETTLTDERIEAAVAAAVARVQAAHGARLRG